MKGIFTGQTKHLRASLRVEKHAAGVAGEAVLDRWNQRETNHG